MQRAIESPRGKTPLGLFLLYNILYNISHRLRLPDSVPPSIYEPHPSSRAWPNTVLHSGSLNYYRSVERDVPPLDRLIERLPHNTLRVLERPWRLATLGKGVHQRLDVVGVEAFPQQQHIRADIGRRAAFTRQDFGTAGRRSFFIWIGAYCEKTCSSATRTFWSSSEPAAQSVTLSGSLSRSPWNAGPPVH
jgi:hypothetical protein